MLYQPIQFDIGVFSKKYIDFGSYTLIDTFIPNSTKKSLLDVGCGYGPIGITIAKLYPYLNIKMIDINLIRTNRDLVKENIKKATEVAEQLEQASKDGDVEEQKKMLTEFGNLNEEIQKEPVQDLLLYYNSEIEFSIGDDVLSADLTIPDLCNRAKAWYKGYESAVDRLIADLHEKFIDRL